MTRFPSSHGLKQELDHAAHFQMFCCDRNASLTGLMTVVLNTVPLVFQPRDT